ncbi:hypothetical protein A3D78_07640 [Candidatus Gottesmanbacteria bacterium RIFCSPHIGHO2_02_FULL_39_14]|uniref:Glycosyltransferase RgtA/B/C/D-like domain-containing protein n=1 Tax=Candidatus Gottesmanbacteria bacterium RIFCSPHIGHO2_02_FULL_39_14 TaxID=1798383 RepID=A0A1F5ZX84_9BACT|nr:MAG: hypothetical protein A3D78_07640 [Candidatus Gottesmanbacteria bacterium RIFCSPHIGHO2_02_FULL_39_14]
MLLFLILILSFLFYGQTLNFYFISDDFYYLSFANFRSIFFPQHFSQHYIPLFLAVLLIIKKNFGLNPFPFHLLTVAVHLVNSVFFYVLAKQLLKGFLPLIAVAVFTFTFHSYETVFWITGLSLSLMLMFSLLTFNIFLYGLKTGKKSLLFLVNLFSIASILSHEYGFSIIIFICLYLLIFTRKKFAKYLYFILPPFLLWLSITVWKLISGITLSSGAVTPYSFLTTVIKTFTYLLLPFPYILDRLHKILIIVLFSLLLIFIYGKSSKPKLRLFLFLWLTFDILLIAATSLPQARYYYFISVPAILLLLSVISSISRKMVILFALLIIFQGLIFLTGQKTYWSKTSMITKNQLKKIRLAYSELPADKKIYLVNFPDSLNGPPWNAYLFRNGLDYAVKQLYSLDPKKLVFVNSGTGKYLRSDPYKKCHELTKLSIQGNRIIFYE